MLQSRRGDEEQSGDNLSADYRKGGRVMRKPLPWLVLTVALTVVLHVGWMLYIMTSRSQRYEPAGDEQVVVSPTHKGILLVRMIVADRNDEEELARLKEAQHKMYVESVIP